MVKSPLEREPGRARPVRPLNGVLPPPVRVLRLIHPFMKRQIRHIPFGLVRTSVEALMRGALQDPIRNGELEFLRGRWLQFYIMDLGVRWNVTLGLNGPILVQSAVRPDVIISGDLRYFVEMANADNDPDTFFFQRKIKVEGDTEMSLWIKNTLFASEKPRWVQVISTGLGQFLNAVELD